jgi:hypothetical protein
MKTGWIVASAAVGAAVVIGHPPGQAGTEEAGPVPAPAVLRKPTVSRRARSRYASSKREAYLGGQFAKSSLSIRNIYETVGIGEPVRADHPIR